MITKQTNQMSGEEIGKYINKQIGYGVKENRVITMGLPSRYDHKGKRIWESIEIGEIDGNQVYLFPMRDHRVLSLSISSFLFLRKDLISKGIIPKYIAANKGVLSLREITSALVDIVENIEETK